MPLGKKEGTIIKLETVPDNSISTWDICGQLHFFHITRSPLLRHDVMHGSGFSLKNIPLEPKLLILCQSTSLKSNSIGPKYLSTCQHPKSKSCSLRPEYLNIFFRIYEDIRVYEYILHSHMNIYEIV